MAEKSQNADSGKEIKEKKEKTTQQQKGLPTLSADLKKKRKRKKKEKKRGYLANSVSYDTTLRIPKLSAPLVPDILNNNILTRIEISD